MPSNRCATRTKLRQRAARPPRSCNHGAHPQESRKESRSRGQQDSSEVCALVHRSAGEAQAGNQGLRVHAPEPGDRAGRYAVDSRDGGEGSALGGDRRSKQVAEEKFLIVTRRTEKGRTGKVHNEF